MRAMEMKSILLLAALGVAFGTARSAEAAIVRRFAILIGNNGGGPDVEDLRYARDDAQKMRAVLTELGGYAPEDVAVVLGESAEDVRRALAHLESRVVEARAEGAQTTLLLYYSGHAKFGALRLENSQLPMSQVRTLLRNSAANIRIGIIDACESGTLTREKGGTRGPSFLFDADDREPTHGLILISSSSADESSQESDELGGSFFTHYLASGLRGDADESADRRVTLGEAYRYTYHKTVAITAHTRSGTQHPTYRYDLEGQADIILTDLSRGRSTLTFPENLEGDYLVFDLTREQMVAEISKRASIPRRIALAPGRYAIKKRMPDHLRIQEITIADGTEISVDESSMRRVAFEDDLTKGSTLRAERKRPKPRWTLQAVAVYQRFFSANARDELFPSLVLWGASVEIGPFLNGRIGLEALFGTRRDLTLELGELQARYRYLQTEAAVFMTWGLELGPLRLYAGPRLAALYMLRSFEQDPRLTNVEQDLFGLSPSATAGLTFYLTQTRDLGIDLTSRFGVLLYSVDDNRTLVYGELGLRLGYRL